MFDTCTFNRKLILNKINKTRVYLWNCNINDLDCLATKFEREVEIKECNIKYACFYSALFKAPCNFYKTSFNRIDFTSKTFENTIFEDIVIFSEAKFNNGVDFKYTKFLSYSAFKDTVIKGKLNLRDTIFGNEAEANFLDITSEKGTLKDIDVENRETARLIKSFHEHSNNIIESNKFYALEMKEREKELNQDIKNRKNIFEWFIFKAHGIASNHSQDWILPMLWIFTVGLIYSMYVSTFHHNNILANISILTVIVLFFINNNAILKIVLGINLIILLLLAYISLDKIADKINPFSIMTGKDPMTFGLLLFKITIAYLIYQFIVSVRQNTRRK